MPPAAPGRVAGGSRRRLFCVDNRSEGTGNMSEQMTTDLNLPSRTLLGPGPSNVHPRVTRALTAPVVGYLDPAWFSVMDDTTALLRQVYGTNNHVTFPLSGTGSSGMEGLLFNILEQGDKILIGVNGF